MAGKMARDLWPEARVDDAPAQSTEDDQDHDKSRPSPRASCRSGVEERIEAAHLSDRLVRPRSRP